MNQSISEHTNKKRVQNPRFFSFEVNWRVPLLLLLLSLNLFITSCKKENQSTDSGTYFSVRNFFTAEATRLAKLPILLNKTALSNQDSSNQRIEKVNWKKELTLFTESDINKPAWKQLFKIDSLRSADGLKLSYRSIEASIPVKQILLTFKAGKLEKISAEKETNNFVFKSTEEWSYIPDSGYVLNVNQKVLWFFQNNYEVRGSFINSPVLN